MTVKLMQEETHRIISQRAEAIDWAISKFLEDNPDLEIQDTEIIYLEGNPFAYYIRERRPLNLDIQTLRDANQTLKQERLVSKNQYSGCLQANVGSHSEM